jgi:uncharacterized protein (TIGR02246 family)
MAVLLLAASPIWAQPANREASGTARDLEAIEKLDEVDAAAAKVNDVGRLTALWTKDGVLILPMSAPVAGRANIHRLLEQQKQQAAGAQTISYVETWKERRIVDSTAFEWGTITATLRLSKGKEVTQTVYAARYLERARDGSWRVSRAVVTPGPRSSAAKHPR